jgi:hypothetical protein
MDQRVINHSATRLVANAVCSRMSPARVAVAAEPLMPYLDPEHNEVHRALCRLQLRPLTRLERVALANRMGFRV